MIFCRQKTVWPWIVALQMEPPYVKTNLGNLFSSYSATHHQSWPCLACSVLSWSGRILWRPSLHFPLWCCWQQQRQIGGSAHNCILLMATRLTTASSLFKTQLSHASVYSQITVFHTTSCFDLESASWPCLRGWSDRPALQYFALACVADTAAARRCRWGESYRVALQTYLKITVWHTNTSFTN